MIEIISPTQFKTVPWKNGKGETIEMAINSGGTLDEFDWRLSMASVVEDGIFSNFSGYTRNLILIAGNGINLQHNDSKIDKLTHLLDYATFDGGNKTVGNLPSGEITDFNVITRSKSISASVACLQNQQNYNVENAELCFIYSLQETFQLNDGNSTSTIPAQHLVKISENNAKMSINGEQIIVVYLHKR